MYIFPVKLPGSPRLLLLITGAPHISCFTVVHANGFSVISVTVINFFSCPFKSCY